MIEIIDRLYLGGDEDVPKAKLKGFAIASLCKEGPYGHRATLKYTTHAAPKGKNYYYVELPKFFAGNLIDSNDPNYIPAAVIDPALAFIHKHHSIGENVLVHCNRGISRGPTTTLMYLRTIGEMPHSFVQSEKVFRTLYPKYDPAMGIRQYARSHWSALEDIYG